MLKTKTKGKVIFKTLSTQASMEQTSYTRSQWWRRTTAVVLVKACDDDQRLHLVAQDYDRLAKSWLPCPLLVSLIIAVKLLLACKPVNKE